MNYSTRKKHLSYRETKMKIYHENSEKNFKNFQIYKENNSRFWLDKYHLELQKNCEKLNLCRLICKKCKICIHQFTCSCINNFQKKQICIYIHS